VVGNRVSFGFKRIVKAKIVIMMMDNSNNNGKKVSIQENEA
jgi:hypothetical protein